MASPGRHSVRCKLATIRALICWYSGLNAGARSAVAGVPGGTFTGGKTADMGPDCSTKSRRLVHPMSSIRHKNSRIDSKTRESPDFQGQTGLNSSPFSAGATRRRIRGGRAAPLPLPLPRRIGMSKKPVRVAVTGAAGQIGYAILFRIASGEMLGKDQPVILELLEVPMEKPQQALQGVMMELQDCAFPLLVGMEAHSDPMTAFKDADYAMLIGSRPRGPGMERAELLAVNAEIFTAQGKALNAVASRNVKVLVVGNPANTNAYIAMKSAPSLPRENFTAMLRLDHNRALSQLAAKSGKPVGAIEKLIVWGNHSPTMYPDYRFATVDGASLKDLINDENWNRTVFLPTVGKRGAAIIAARGVSSAASAANAAIDHMRDWALGSNGKWVTMGIPSDGQYGIPKDVMFGFPVTCAGGEYKLVEGLPIDAFSQERINVTLAELQEEQDGVKHLL